MRNNRIVSQNNEFIGALNYARSEAIRRSGSVSVCSSTNGHLFGTTNWATGWIVFVDANADGTLNASDGADALLQTCGCCPARFTLKATNGTSCAFWRHGHG